MTTTKYTAKQLNSRERLFELLYKLGLKSKAIQPTLFGRAFYVESVTFDMKDLVLWPLIKSDVKYNNE